MDDQEEQKKTRGSWWRRGYRSTEERIKKGSRAITAGAITAALEVIRNARQQPEAEEITEEQRQQYTKNCIFSIGVYVSLWLVSLYLLYHSATVTTPFPVVNPFLVGGIFLFIVSVLLVARAVVDLRELVRE